MQDIAALRERFAHVAVELVAWPGEPSLRTALARQGIPRLLVVEEGAELPRDLGLAEDWVRLPVDVGDVDRRVQRLLRVAADLAPDEPFVDDHHVLHRGGATLPLTAREAALVTFLLVRRGTVVTIDELDQVWGGTVPSRDAVEAAVYRLRRRLAPLHLVIRAVRARGFVIDVRRSAA